MAATDQVSYVLSAFSNQMYTNPRHVICIVHALHNICESVRVENFRGSDFISEMKKDLHTCIQYIVS